MRIKKALFLREILLDRTVQIFTPKNLHYLMIFLEKTLSVVPNVTSFLHILKSMPQLK